MKFKSIATKLVCRLWPLLSRLVLVQLLLVAFPSARLVGLALVGPLVGLVGPWQKAAWHWPQTLSFCFNCLRVRG